LLTSVIIQLGGIQIKRKAFFTLAIFLIIIALLLGLSVDTLGHKGGKGDGVKEYNCINSCHKAQSSGTMEMMTDKPSVIAGEEIKVTVVLKNTETPEGRKIGVFLVTVLEGKNSIPSATGWSIIQDPNGGTNNYVEKNADAERGNTFEWIIKTPETPGTYVLYSREDHGNGDKYFNDYTEGLEIEVKPDPSKEVPDDGGDENGGGDGSDGGDGDGSSKSDIKGNTTDSQILDPITNREPDFRALLLALTIAGIIVIITYLMRP
jgi:hypothetical protein